MNIAESLPNTYRLAKLDSIDLSLKYTNICTSGDSSLDSSLFVEAMLECIEEPKEGDPGWKEAKHNCERDAKTLFSYIDKDGTGTFSSEEWIDAYFTMYSRSIPPKAGLKNPKLTLTRWLPEGMGECTDPLLGDADTLREIELLNKGIFLTPLHTGRGYLLQVTLTSKTEVGCIINLFREKDASKCKVVSWLDVKAQKDCPLTQILLSASQGLGVMPSSSCYTELFNNLSVPKRDLVEKEFLSGAKWPALFESPSSRRTVGTSALLDCTSVGNQEKNSEPHESTSSDASTSMGKLRSALMEILMGDGKGVEGLLNSLRTDTFDKNKSNSVGSEECSPAPLPRGLLVVGQWLGNLPLAPGPPHFFHSLLQLISPPAFKASSLAETNSSKSSFFARAPSFHWNLCGSRRGAIHMHKVFPDPRAAPFEDRVFALNWSKHIFASYLKKHGAKGEVALRSPTSLITVRSPSSPPPHPVSVHVEAGKGEPTPTASSGAGRGLRYKEAVRHYERILHGNEYHFHSQEYVKRNPPTLFRSKMALLFPVSKSLSLASPVEGSENASEMPPVCDPTRVLVSLRGWSAGSGAEEGEGKDDMLDNCLEGFRICLFSQLKDFSKTKKVRLAIATRSSVPLAFALTEAVACELNLGALTLLERWIAVLETSIQELPSFTQYFHLNALDALLDKTMKGDEAIGYVPSRGYAAHEAPHGGLSLTDVGKGFLATPPGGKMFLHSSTHEGFAQLLDAINQSAGVRLQKLQVLKSAVARSRETYSIALDGESKEPQWCKASCHLQIALLPNY